MMHLAAEAQTGGSNTTVIVGVILTFMLGALGALVRLAWSDLSRRQDDIRGDVKETRTTVTMFNDKLNVLDRRVTRVESWQDNHGLIIHAGVLGGRRASDPDLTHVLYEELEEAQHRLAQQRGPDNDGNS